MCLPEHPRQVLLCQSGKGEPICPPLHGVAILPGAFNPVHDGHRSLRNAASAFLGRPVCMELSLTNVDKPPLGHADVGQRIARMPDLPVYLTRAPLFTEKAELFRDSWFVVGFDTAERILNPRYYNGALSGRDEALNHLQIAGVRILVAGRTVWRDSRSVFLGRGHLHVPSAWGDLFTELPEKQFRLDLSSTDIRRRQTGNG